MRARVAVLSVAQICPIDCQLLANDADVNIFLVRCVHYS